MTRDEAVLSYSRLGQTRFAMVTCMTCMDRANVRYRAEVDAGILPVLEREIGRCYSHPVERARLTAELEAASALIAQHRGEFDDYLAGLDAAGDLAAQRRKRGVRR